jgi:hypothetical protein
MERYSVIRERLHEALMAKTSWGRNELRELIDRVLLGVADDELDQQAPPAYPRTQDPPPPPPW